MSMVTFEVLIKFQLYPTHTHNYTQINPMQQANDSKLTSIVCEGVFIKILIFSLSLFRLKIWFINIPLPSHQQQQQQQLQQLNVDQKNQKAISMTLSENFSLKWHTE